MSAKALQIVLQLVQLLVFTKAQAKIPRVLTGSGLILIPALTVEFVCKFAPLSVQFSQKKDLGCRKLPAN
ncbi:hypothetical protein WN50_00295 [Limnoraphis robusta CS-951]|uniref:Uncharacterized protein n=1 Tax=Limnoraphis robusta CS-951 TaxID=1637645 RepID=A0A0F5YM38_9CYAN|nr:hypothetical protein WN50_00295 [Limnoraphis robusta CS-951]